jgi:predicted kinase
MSYVVVTGLPGSGKSTLARTLSQALGMPLISRDAIKEQLAGPGAREVTPEESGRLGEVAFERVFELAAEADAAVIEASWHPDRGRGRIADLPGPVIEVHCACPADIARRRYIERAKSRHHAHLDSNRLDDAELWSPTHARALGLSDPVIEVDSTAPIDVEGTADEIRQHPGWM